MNNILFVTHKKTQCGIYNFGIEVADILRSSKKFNFIHTECASLQDLNNAIKTHQPVAVIYNYHPIVLPWLAKRIAPKLSINHIHNIPVLQIGIMHEFTQALVDKATNYRKKFFPGQSISFTNSIFDFYIAPDPTLLLRNPNVFKTGRLVPKYENNFALPSKPTFGSFGFGTPNKGFEKIVELVQNEYDEAIIRLNISKADFGASGNVNVESIAEKCKAMVTKNGIELQITHDYWDNKSMLDFLAKNSCNIFLYQDTNNRGVASTVEHAMAVKRPIAVSDSIMFRHVLDTTPSICVSKNSLKTIIANGFQPLQKHYDEWNADDLLWEYERIVTTAIQKWKFPTKPKMGKIRTIVSKWNRIFSMPDKSFTWLRDVDAANQDDMSVDTSVEYQPVTIPNGITFNRILDNSARALYKPAIDKLFQLVPKTMSKKIPEANVQQAFVFDTVFRNLNNYSQPKLLCVGSYEDTASMSLLKMGYNVEEIDPMLNYYLQEYYTKPSVLKNTYDIIFSTSVIEHDPDDESFVKCIDGLLAPGGLCVITCDYKDGWKPGEPKPEVDARFYVQSDLKQRLLKHMPSCTLIDEPNWDCPNPDFFYDNKYQYTFATFVVRKDK